MGELLAIQGSNITLSQMLSIVSRPRLRLPVMLNFESLFS